MRHRSLLVALLLLATPLASARAAGTVGPDVPAFTVRDGFRVTLVAKDLPEVRFVEFGADGTLYLSQPNAGTITALRDKDGDGTYETRTPFVTGRKTAHGMHFVGGWLWFTQSGSVHKARDTDGDGRADETITVVADGLPSGGGHWWRAICVTRDGFYTSIGDDGNIKEHTNDERCRIYRFDLDGKNKREFASGLRNTEKLRLRPGTNDLYGCDHGSDNYGQRFGEKRGLQPVTDLNPPCEFNHYAQGQFYGHPYVTGNKLPRLEFMDRSDIVELANKTVPPAWSFGGHWAPNGWTFVATDEVIDRPGDALVALHGSWNSSVKVGYQVARILFDDMTGKPYGLQTIVGTLGRNGDVLARPCDVAEAPDGTLLFTCDQTRRIYRIAREAK